MFLSRVTRDEVLKEEEEVASVCNSKVPLSMICSKYSFIAKYIESFKDMTEGVPEHPHPPPPKYALPLIPYNRLKALS